VLDLTDRTFQSNHAKYAKLTLYAPKITHLNIQLLDTKNALSIFKDHIPFAAFNPPRITFFLDRHPQFK
jgi:hypothetical protein